MADISIIHDGDKGIDYDIKDAIGRANCATGLQNLEDCIISILPESAIDDTPPISFLSNGDPLSSVVLSGNGQQTGTPTPDNPVMPTFCGVRTGNLFDINATPTKYSQSTIVTVDGQTLTITGTWYIYYEIDVAPNTDYYVKWAIDYAEIEGRGSIAILTTSGQTIHNQSTNPYSFNSGENQRIRLLIYSASSTSSTVRLSNIMLNSGSTALPYEPYGWKAPFENHGENLFDESNFVLLPVSETTSRKGTNLGVLPQGTYTFDAVSTSSATPIYRTTKNGSTYTFEAINSLPYTFTADGVSEQIIRTSGTQGNAWTDVGYSDIMLNLGDTPEPYSPYLNETIPIYLGQTQTVRKIRKLVLTGEETIIRDREREGSWRFFTDKLISAKSSAAICSHFENIGTYDVNNSDNIGFSIFNNAQFGCRCPKSIAATTADFKSYLAAQYANGTPVTVWYVLANEQTRIVNEPLAKIGDYADELSSEDAGVSIPTAKGQNTLTVETDLQPSGIKVTGNIVGTGETESHIVTDNADIPTDILSDSDLDTYITDGVYRITDIFIAATILNAPVTNVKYILEVFSVSGTDTIQRITTESDIYTRQKSSGVWGSWYKFTGTEVSA